MSRFPLTTKAHVSGKEAHPFYAWARQKVGILGSPKWNFQHSHRPGRDFGRLVFDADLARASRVVKAIEKVLPAKA